MLFGTLFCVCLSDYGKRVGDKAVVVWPSQSYRWYHRVPGELYHQRCGV